MVQLWTQILIKSLKTSNTNKFCSTLWLIMHPSATSHNQIQSYQILPESIMRERDYYFKNLSILNTLSYSDWNLFWDAKILRTREIMTLFKLFPQFLRSYWILFYFWILRIGSPDENSSQFVLEITKLWNIEFEYFTHNYDYFVT